MSKYYGNVLVQEKGEKETRTIVKVTSEEFGELQKLSFEFDGDKYHAEDVANIAVKIANNQHTIQEQVKSATSKLNSDIQRFDRLMLAWRKACGDAERFRALCFWIEKDVKKWGRGNPTPQVWQDYKSKILLLDDHGIDVSKPIAKQLKHKGVPVPQEYAKDKEAVIDSITKVRATLDLVRKKDKQEADKAKFAADEMPVKVGTSTFKGHSITVALNKLYKVFVDLTEEGQGQLVGALYEDVLKPFEAIAGVTREARQKELEEIAAKEKEGQDKAKQKQQADSPDVSDLQEAV